MRYAGRLRCSVRAFAKGGGNVANDDDAQQPVFDPNTDVDCTGLEPWEVLQALFDNTRPTPHFRLPPGIELTERQAKTLIGEYRLKKLWRFDYVRGRPIKVSIVEPADGLRWWISRADLYDRDSKRKAAEIVAELKFRKERTDG